MYMYFLTYFRCTVGVVFCSEMNYGVLGFGLSQFYHYQFKIVVAGEIAVGKTSLVRKFTGNPSTPRGFLQMGGPKVREVVMEDQPTLTIESFEKRVQIHDQRFNLVITDIGGSERFSTTSGSPTVSSHYANAAGVMLVFDLTNRRSFYETIKWMDDVRKASTVNMPVFILVGNKKDKRIIIGQAAQFQPVTVPKPAHQTESASKINHIKTYEGESMADAYRIDYIETSATDGSNVTDAFALLSGKIYEAMVDGKIRLCQGWNGVLSYDDVQRQQQHVKEQPPQFHGLTPVVGAKLPKL